MIGQYITLTYIVADRATTVLGRITGAHNGVIQAQRTLLSATTGLTLGMLGLAATGARATHSLKANFIDLNAAADETRLGMAGMLNALGYSAGMMQAQDQSKKLYDQLLRLSGPLPGEAEAYINSFQLSIGALSTTMGAFQSKYGDKGLFNGTSGFDKEMTAAKDQLSKMAAFSAYWQATAVSSNVAEALAARDLPRLLSGHVTAQTRSWQKMSPQFQAASEGKVTDTKSFNALDDAERLALMVKVVHNMSAAVDIASGKTTALSGSISTTITQWKMLAGERAYGVYLNYLKQFDAYLRDHKAELDKIASIVSGQLTAGLVKMKTAMIDSFGWFLRHKDKIIDALNDIKFGFASGLHGPNGAGTHTLMGGIANRAGSFVRSGKEGYALAKGESGGHPYAMALGAVATGAMIARAMPAAMAVGGITSASDAIAGLGMVGESLAASVAGLSILPAAITVAIAAPFAAIAAGMVQGAITTPGAIEAPGRLMMALMDLVAPIMVLLDPFIKFGALLGSVVVEVLPPLIEIITSLITLTISPLIAIFKLLMIGLETLTGLTLADTMSDFRMFGDFLHWLAMKIRSYYLFADNPDPGSWEAYSQTEEQRRDGMHVGGKADVPTFDGFNDSGSWYANNLLTGQIAKTGKNKKTPGDRATTINDFRGSRFDITQKFAEGFDPDRIAVTFMNALQSTADQATASKLQANAGTY